MGSSSSGLITLVVTIHSFSPPHFADWNTALPRVTSDILLATDQRKCVALLVVTQFYLPCDRGDVSATTATTAGTRFIDPRWMEVDLSRLMRISCSNTARYPMSQRAEWWNAAVTEEHRRSAWTERITWRSWRVSHCRSPRPCTASRSTGADWQAADPYPDPYIWRVRVDLWGRKWYP